MGVVLTLRPACMCAKLLQSCLTLCDSSDCIPPESSVHGILQARILEWIAMPSSRGSGCHALLRTPFPPQDQTRIFRSTALAGRFSTTSTTWEDPLRPAAAKLLQSCPTLCDPIDGSPPGSAIPGILQARTLEWVAILLQCMKVKSESEVAQSCPTPSDPMDCSPAGPSVHGIFQARVLEWGAITFSALRPRFVLNYPRLES